MVACPLKGPVGLNLEKLTKNAWDMMIQLEFIWMVFCQIKFHPCRESLEKRASLRVIRIGVLNKFAVRLLVSNLKICIVGRYISRYHLQAVKSSTHYILI